MEDKIKKFAEFLKESEYVVFFGGAGVSTESNIPDFRSKDGLYNKRDVRFENYEPEYLLSHSCLMNDTKVFFEFYRQKMDARKALPNDAHKVLAKLEAAGKVKAVITQNIDGLHQQAGSKNVYEIHGTTKRNYCERCLKNYPEDYIFDCKEEIPRCSCGGIVRPFVTLYEEQLPEDAVYGAIDAIKKADMLIIGGTSLTVYPAAGYVRYFSGKHLVIINKDHIAYPLNSKTDLEINAPIGKVMREVIKLI